MSELEYIEDYFANTLSGKDKKAFEARCENDPDFAKAVGFYILSRQTLHDALTEDKKKEFLEQYHQLALENTEAGTGRRTWFSYIAAAAACILLLIAYLTYSPGKSPEKLADAYIEENLTTLSTTMSGATDSLAMAIGAFNDKDYGKAETIFQLLGKNEDLLPETTEYLGITYLKTGQYDKAIEQFDKLISITGLYANPGKFYMAVTLMKRAGDGDSEKAKRLLQEVISGRLPGYKEASVWMKDL